MNPLLDPGAHPVIGHRGASGLAPENTRAALELALAQGADALEFDVQCSADGVPVLMHDKSLDRTTAASGLLCERTAAELGALDAGHHFTLDHGGSFPWRGRSLGVPTLAEVLQAFPGVPVLIELKSVDVAEPVRRVLLEHGARERAVLASFLELALAPFREGGFHTGACRNGILTLWLRSKIGLGAPAGPDEIYAVPDRYREKVHVPTASFIRGARRAGRPVHVWTVNDPARAAWLWRRGASGIITNFPALMLEERKQVFS
jgi:glycerophosphoryl diester phosphodiesterase